MEIDQEVVKYIERYYPTIQINDDFVYQERIRKWTAEDKEATPEEIATGWCTKKHIDNTLESVMISSELRNLINEKFSTLPPYPENIRGPIKAILTFPMKGYLPWDELFGVGDILETASLIAKDVSCQLKIVEGKVYAMIDKFNDLLFEKANLKERRLLDMDLEPNSETSHITVVNSDVLCKVDQNRVMELIQEVEKEGIDIKFTAIKHTVSLDWPRFSICCVIALKSAAITNFVNSFNKEFGTKIAPATHITFLVRNRDRKNKN